MNFRRCKITIIKQTYKASKTFRKISIQQNINYTTLYGFIFCLCYLEHKCISSKDMSDTYLYTLYVSSLTNKAISIQSDLRIYFKPSSMKRVLYKLIKFYIFLIMHFLSTLYYTIVYSYI